MIIKQTTKILTDEITRTINGLNRAADVITSTMGGTGKNVILSNSDDVNFTKDGVSVAKEIRFTDPEENIGAQLLINAANKTVEQCGDGTTLTSLLTKEFVNTLFKELKNSKDLNTDLEKYEDLIENTVIPKLMAVSTKIKSADDIYHIAMTSCKSSRLAKFIQEIYLKTGMNANISVELSRISDKTYYEISEGLYFEGGMIHPSFANQDNKSCVFEKPFMIVTDQNIQDPQDYQEIMDDLNNRKIPMVFIAPSFSDAFIRFCVTNKQRVGLQVCLIRTPGYAHGQIENIKDIKTFISTDGHINRINVTPYDFTLYNQLDKDRLKRRVDQLKAAAESAVEDYDAANYYDRIHRLQQSSAIIYVGAPTDKAAKEEYDRIEDAVGAVKSALKLGYVYGGGVTLAYILHETFELRDNEPETQILSKILQKPYLKIMSNANFEVDHIPTKPIDVRTGKTNTNIIDPTHVLIEAIRNSFSLAKLLINTSYIVYNE